MQNALATVSLNRSAANANAGHLEQAIPDFLRAVEIGEALVAAYPDVPGWRRQLEQARVPARAPGRLCAPGLAFAPPAA